MLDDTFTLGNQLMKKFDEGDWLEALGLSTGSRSDALKEGTFGPQNMGAFHESATVDRHEVRRALASRLGFQPPKALMSGLGLGPNYGGFEDLMRRVANSRTNKNPSVTKRWGKASPTTAAVQGYVWTGGGPATGVRSNLRLTRGEQFDRLVAAQQLMRGNLDMSPQALREYGGQMLKGQAPFVPLQDPFSPQVHHIMNMAAEIRASGGKTPKWFK